MDSLDPDEKEQLEKMLDEYRARDAERRALQYAGFWKRFWASLIDGLILLVADSILGTLLAGIIPKLVGGLLWGFIPRPAEYISFLVAWIYYAVMESSSLQATIGKMAIGIIVVDLNGNRVSFYRASNRFFAKVLSALLLFVGYIMAGFTKRKQALHDIIARCLVIMK